MALKGGVRFSVRFEDVFPNGCVLVPDSITAAQDFDEKTRARTPSLDKLTGQRVWQCRVMDMDEELKGRSREVSVKILADVQPVPPVGPFEPVEFEGMTVTPYVSNSGRLSYAYRATGLRAPASAAETRRRAA